jgi:hypothetical protein
VIGESGHCGVPSILPRRRRRTAQRGRDGPRQLKESRVAIISKLTLGPW